MADTVKDKAKKDGVEKEDELQLEKMEGAQFLRPVKNIGLADRYRLYAVYQTLLKTYLDKGMSGAQTLMALADMVDAVGEYAVLDKSGWEEFLQGEHRSADVSSLVFALGSELGKDL